MTEINKFYYISSSKREFDLPTRGTAASAGYDLHSPVDLIIHPGETVAFSLEIKAQIKSNQVLLIVPRSSIGWKYHVGLVNTIGVIDSDYYNNIDNEGEIKIKLHNFGEKDFEIHKNDKVAQAIFMTYDITEDDTASGVRNGGFGSTGK